MSESAQGPQGFPIERTIDGYDYVSLIAVKFTLERVKELETALLDCVEQLEAYRPRSEHISTGLTRCLDKHSALIATLKEQKV